MPSNGNSSKPYVRPHVDAEPITDFTVSGSNHHCVLTGIETVVVEDRPIPEAGDNEVLVKVMSTGICGTDVSYYSKGRIGGSVITQPHVLGHESAGIVYAVGKDVDSVKPGDRVAIEPSLPCRDCRFCKEGAFNYCKNERYLAAPHTDGTLCQWYACPARNAVKIPSNLSWEEAGCIQPLAIAIQIARRANLRPHAHVVVLGAGPLGLLCMAVARSYGARSISTLDLSAERLAFAAKYAATHTFVSRTPEPGADVLEFHARFAEYLLDAVGAEDGIDVVIDTTGAEGPIQLGIALLRTGGNFVQAGLGAPLVAFPILQVATKEITVSGAFHYTARCFEDGIDLLERGLVDVRPLVTKTFGLTQSEDAFKAVRSGHEIKVVIRNQD